MDNVTTQKILFEIEQIEYGLGKNKRRFKYVFKKQLSALAFPPCRILARHFYDDFFSLRLIRKPRNAEYRIAIPANVAIPG